MPPFLGIRHDTARAPRVSDGWLAVNLHVAFVNVGLVAIWLLLNVGIAREHKKLVPDDRGAAP